MEDEKIFSVIIPVYNGEKTIERALASLISNRDWIYEVIIVNDHSTDNTFKKVEPFKEFLPIKIFDNEGPHNPGAARKTGLLKASGQWVTFLDADDCFTATSFKYIKQKIENREKDKPLTVYPLFVRLDIGNFDSYQIDFSELSCVGNFYKLDYLLEHKLYPSEDLPLAEDEYYGQKIQIYINHVDHRLQSLIPYAYPVYEIHHDDEHSLALSNWVEYLLHYHLYYQQVLTEDFLQYEDIIPALRLGYTENFIFCYFLYLCLLENDIYDPNEIKSKIIYFKEALKFAEQKLGIQKEFMIDFFLNHEDIVTDAIKGAMNSTMSDPPKDGWSFEEFISEVENMLYYEYIHNNNSSL